MDTEQLKEYWEKRWAKLHTEDELVIEDGVIKKIILDTPEGWSKEEEIERLFRWIPKILKHINKETIIMFIGSPDLIDVFYKQNPHKVNMGFLGWDQV